MDILPIDKEVLDQNEEDDKREAESKALKEPQSLSPIEEDEEDGEVTQEAIFEKPKPKAKESVTLNKNGKPRKPLSDKQLENLRKAREAGAIKRKALKEARDIEKAERKLKREMVSEAKIVKKEEQDLKIRLAAQMNLDEKKATHFSEERLAKLMEKTLDNYIAKKKAMKPAPRETIPYPHPEPPQQQYQQQQYYQQPPPKRKPKYQTKTQTRTNNVMDTLFGNFD